MAQRKKKLMKKKRHIVHREPDESDGGDFEVAAKIMDDDSPGRKLPRFPGASSECLSDVQPDTRELVRAQKKKKSGGFQSMGKKLMDDQFAALHDNPDMYVQYGLHNILIVFYAGLTEPVLIRLDVDSKLSELLKLSFFHLKMDDKPALLLHLLRNVAKPQEQTVVFVSLNTVWLSSLLSSEGVECAYIYSALDQTARKINIGKFVHCKAMVLIVTDVAARGIDIPLLDNVINYNFPSKAKLFLHRVGRVARAGRGGAAYSLVCTDEIPFVFDLHFFLGRPLQLATPDHQQESDGVFGRVPQSILDEESQLITAHENSHDLQNLRRIADNAYKQYIKSRPMPSPESFKRVKNTELPSMAVHPLLGSGLEKMELERLEMVDCIKGYKAKATIFETSSNSKTNASMVTLAKRSRDTRLVDNFTQKKVVLAADSRYHVPVTALPSTRQTRRTVKRRTFSKADIDIPLGHSPSSALGSTTT
uniref:DEAD (Asp-Glu-Ala-Asp) box polypeptide 54 n=1 Tax=Salmo trutta TaxID=8032 RepID=A0A673XFG0_SALTR